MEIGIQIPPKLDGEVLQRDGTFVTETWSPTER
jgi:hypothetical protein